MSDSAIALGAIGNFVIGISPIGGPPPVVTPRTPDQTNVGAFAPTQVKFAPTPGSAFRFQATFDGQPYEVTVTWNVAGRRWYVSVADVDGTRVLTIPMIGSPPDTDISLTAGYFSSTLVFRAATQTFEVSP